MNAKTTRLLKEARALFWPWCAVTCLGALALVHPPHGGDLFMVAFLLGFLLLATLPFGNEFQHRTLSLLLVQPVSRMEIWGEKLSVMAVAIVSAALVLILGWRVSALQLDPGNAAFFGAWVISTGASAAYWTLFAKSTLGGLALNISINGFVIEMPWLILYHEKLVAVSLPPSNVTVLTITFLLLCYAGAMLWLGARKLERFQATGGMAGDDLLMAGPSVMPGALAGWFRCRPTGALLNLIRKELRLLRPLWLITLASVLGWTCITLLRLVPEHGFGRLILPHDRSSLLSLYTVGPVAALSIAIAIFAGSLSPGEERTSGTHAWHMTLPVPARRQWLVKLVMAMLTGLVCGGLLPVSVVIAGGSLFGSPLMFVDLHASMYFLLAVSLLSFASFWCACAVNGTARAVLWVFPMLGALVIASQFGAWVAPRLMEVVVSRFDLFADFRFTNAVSTNQFFINATPMLVLTLLWGPTLLIAVIQSNRLFREQVQDSILSLIRNLLPLAVTAFLCCFSLLSFNSLVQHAKRQMWTMFRETHEAIEKIQPGTPNLDAAHPLQITVDDLARASPLSEPTRRWLRNSRITVAPDKAHPGPYCCGGNSRSISFAPNKTYSWYLATIHRASGLDCTLSFQAGRGFGILGGICE